MKRRYWIALPALLLPASVALVVAQQPPPIRTHTIIKRGTLNPVPATEDPEIASEVSIRVEGDQRVIVSNGIPNHATGKFPNPGNPNRIRPQRHEYRVPADPQVADQISPMHGEFGVAINGIPFDPGAGEFYAGERGWQYEPLSGAIALGIDVSHAHVQPTGKYHYHGLPTGLIDSIEISAGAHSPLIGWAADGFPMYAVYGYSDPKDASSQVQKLTSSYQLKSGPRPGGNAPSGNYDGTFVQDYEYVAGSGDLDECNGRFCVTPEYPDGTYAYFMTENWPVVPRNYRGTPSSDFRHGPGPSFGRGNNRRDQRRGNRGRFEPFARGPQRESNSRDFGPGSDRQTRLSQPPPPSGLPRPGEILPGFVVDRLELTDEQSKQLEELQDLVDTRLADILTDEQRTQLEASLNLEPGYGRRGPGRADSQGGGQNPRPQQLP